MNPKQAIIANIVAVLAGALLIFGIDITPDQREVLTQAGVILLAVINGVDNYIAHRKGVTA